MLKEEYTNLKINHDNYDDSDLIVESIEQDSSSKGKKVVESDNYDDYVKLKSENEKLKKDLEKLATTNTIILETLDNDHDMALENEMLREENKRLKMEKNLERLSTHDELREENKKLKLEKEHLKTGLSKFTRGQYLQSELLMNTVMKMDRSGIGFLANQEKKAKAQHQQYKSKPKPKKCFECGQEGYFAHECDTTIEILLRNVSKKALEACGLATCLGYSR